MSEYRILIRTCLQLHVHEYLDSILSQHICQSNVDHIRISSNFPGEMKHSKATPTRLCLAQHLRIDPLHFGTTHWDLVDFTPSNNMAGLGVSQLQWESTGGKMFQCHVRKSWVYSVSCVCVCLLIQYHHATPPIINFVHPFPLHVNLVPFQVTPSPVSPVTWKSSTKRSPRRCTSMGAHNLPMMCFNMLDIWEWSRKFGVQCFVRLFLEQ